MKNTFKISLLLIIFCCVKLQPQDIIAIPKLTIDTNNVLIGDRIKLLLEIESNKKINLVFPAIPDSIGAVEILEKSSIDTLIENNKYRFLQKLELSSFDSGSYTIPPFVFMYEKPGFNSLFPVASDSIVLHFHTVEVDTSKAIKDIKEPLEEPITLDEYIGYIITAIVILVIFLAAWYYLKKYKRRPAKPQYKYDPKIPADVFARSELEKLEKEKLWQSGFVKQYYIRLTDILRLYLERQLGFSALEMTTDEILNAIESGVTARNNIGLIEFILRTADLVKFAKSIPLPDENSRCLSDAFQIVENIANELKTQQEENEKGD